jgi:hypothetical protein
MIYSKINTMTPKEKAEELVNKFIKPTIKWNPVNGVGYYNDLNAAKECALIAVDEMIEIRNEIINTLKSGALNVEAIAFLEEVKQEIENI